MKRFLLSIVLIIAGASICRADDCPPGFGRPEYIEPNPVLPIDTPDSQCRKTYLDQCAEAWKNNLRNLNGSPCQMANEECYDLVCIEGYGIQYELGLLDAYFAYLKCLGIRVD